VRVEFKLGSSPARDGQSAGGRGCLTVFFLVFLAMGSIFTVFILAEATRVAAVWFWPEVDCTVISSGVEETGDDENPYAAAVVFEYEIDGRSVRGSRLTRGASASSSYDAVRRSVDTYPTGTRTTCRVNPEIPDEAVLERRLPWIALAVFLPLIFVAVGAGGIYGVWRANGRAGDGAVESISQRARKGRGKTVELVLGLVFAAIGGGLAVPMLVVPLVRLATASTWVETPATVVGSTLRSWSTDDGTSYRADVLYEYSAGGRIWTSNRRDFFPFSSGDSDGARATLARHPQGSPTVCFVDPADPSRSVLDRRPHAAYLIGLFPLIFLIAGVALTAHARKRPLSPPRTEPSSSPGIEPPNTLSGLESRTGPVGKLVGTIVAAVFWNGIVSVFLWQIVLSFRRGDPEWFLCLFMTPFVLVGLGLMAGVIYFLLALANPRPRLTISPSQPRLGGRLRVEWVFKGRYRRMTRLKIVIEGHEKATYQRGTDTYTDRDAFASFVVTDTPSNWEFGRGAGEIEIPADTMHSFASDHNAVVWSIHVHGEIPRWPDVNETFEIEVRPLAPKQLLP